MIQRQHFWMIFGLLTLLLYLHVTSVSIAYRAIAMDLSCPSNEYVTNKRTTFGRVTATVFGWPSTGGVIVKDAANSVDLVFLGVDRLHASERAATAAEEDAFCEKLYLIGANWWEDEDDYNNVQLGARRRSPVEEQELVFGYPANGGVWVLTYANRNDIPMDFGRINMARDMDERCSIMREYGATYYDDAGQASRIRHTGRT